MGQNTKNAREPALTLCEGRGEGWRRAVLHTKGIMVPHVPSPARPSFLFLLFLCLFFFFFPSPPLSLLLRDPRPLHQCQGKQVGRRRNKTWSS